MPQNQGSASSWSQNMHQDPLSAGVGDEDFTKFLDLDNGYEPFQQMDGGHGHSSLETPMGRLAFGHSDLQDLTGHDHGMMQNMDMSQFQQYPIYQQMGQHHHYQVPPTPVSAEMHAAKFGGQLDNAGQIIFERHQASFTPLVSPAQTPLDSAFGMPDYVMADDFFSPLTSPAIEAQPNFASTNATASPIDLNTEHSANSTPGPASRKRGRKVNLPQQRLPRALKQSPATKAQQKRRQYSLSSMSHEQLETMIESAREERLHPNTGCHVFPSSEDSVSPEPLSEALMRPPPLPSNTGRSPSALRPQLPEQNLPATPAMIMRMPSRQPTSAEQVGDQCIPHEVMEDIALPDAAATATPLKSLSRVETQISVSDTDSTPTISAKTPKLNATSTPRTSALRTQNISNESIDKTKKQDIRIGSRGNKKRQSVSSAAMSPALRPKISPSISPLAPAPAHGMASLSAETSALFLASKSNYQNILDGTHLPGVTYPEALAENLSSKRTSHKIAEQGRRNRINIALKEIEALLPPAITASVKKDKAGSAARDSEDGSPDKLASSNQGASKASTVEMAIVYIKSLQAELQETKEKLDEAQKQIAQGGSNESQSSE